MTELVEAPVRLYPVGRLDLHSEGLVLLTNDGEFANRLAHPSWGHEKEYRVLLDRVPSEDQLREWSGGLSLPDSRQTGPATVWLEDTAVEGPWLRVVLTQGMKRQIRETAETLGLKVKRLIRIRMGALLLGDLEPGTWRELTDREMILVRSAIER